MRLLSILAAATLTMTASVATAATIWAPTNADTDFIQLDFGGNPDTGPGIKTNGGILALFDDSDTGFTDPLEIGTQGGQVEFTNNLDGTWTAVSVDKGGNAIDDPLTLSGNSNFILGIDWGLGFYGDSNYHLKSSPDTYIIVFDGKDGNEELISGNTLAVDLAPIPVPAAVWLFGTGLLGLVAVARRRG